ncbi:fibronectin type III domain-containing protein [Desulfosediminicola sp.]|uniref:fibronectin type III domain-containing protein n=1 Tax=Desulfosediminicola sp. TaxID=2886825 RepID=UPI003AF1F958
MRSGRGAKVAGTLVLGTALLVAGGCGFKNQPVPPDTVVPEAIRDLRYTIEDNGAQLSWTYPVETIARENIEAISTFELFTAEIPLDDYCAGCPVPYGRIIEIDGGQSMLNNVPRVASYQYGPLKNAYKYFFKVQSRTSWLAASDDSNTITFVYHIPAAPPEGLQAAAVDSSVKLSWQPVSTTVEGEVIENTIKYQVFRRTGEVEFARVGGITSDTSYTDKAVVNGQTYDYAVQALMVFDEDLTPGKRSAHISATPIDITPPPVPTGVMVVATGEGNRIIWDPPDEDDTASYKIYRRDDSRDSLTAVGDATVPSTTFIDSSAEEERLYYYSVTALDSQQPPNESERSEEATLRH